MPLPSNPLSAPLLLLGSAASALAGFGVLDLFPQADHTTLTVISTTAIGMSLHMTWVGPAARNRHGALAIGAWLACVWLCSAGLATTSLKHHALLVAVVLEVLLLGLAVTHAPPISWPDRIAGWRRTRERISTELRRSDGLVPWATTAAVNLIWGRADRPQSTDFDQILAELAASEHRVRRAAARLALPDAVRDCLHTAAHTIVADAEVTLADMSIGLERRALDHAARCRDAIVLIEDVPDSERARLARECESLMLELTHDLSAIARTYSRHQDGRVA